MSAMRTVCLVMMMYVVVGLQQQFVFIAFVVLRVWYLYCWMFVSYILYLLVSSCTS